jgi:hypothetical protein
MHWAVYSGSDLTLSYIIAFGGDLNALDIQGLTPLHFACKEYKKNKSTKAIKQLLIKGANRNAIDFDGKRPIDYVPIEQKNGNKELSIEINKLLREEWSFAGDCLVLRTSFRKQTKQPWTLIAYFVLMVTSYLMQLASTYKAIELYGNETYMLIASKTLFFLSITLWFIVWQKDPGFIKRDQSLDFVELLENFESTSLCPDCEVIRTPRCRHCTLCEKCVDRFDHHCPWVNNCIGRSNFAYFYLFVLTQTVYLLSVALLSAKCKYSECKPDSLRYLLRVRAGCVCG